jgi:hypothetical protein
MIPSPPLSRSGNAAGNLQPAVAGATASGAARKAVRLRGAHPELSGQPRHPSCPWAGMACPLRRAARRPPEHRSLRGAGASRWRWQFPSYPVPHLRTASKRVRFFRKRFRRQAGRPRPPDPDGETRGSICPILPWAILCMQYAGPPHALASPGRSRAGPGRGGWSACGRRGRTSSRTARRRPGRAHRFVNVCPCMR